MIKEKRKDIRRALRYADWIGTGETAPLRGCIVFDISDSGAKLDVERAHELPDEFQLLLSGQGGIYRQCARSSARPIRSACISSAAEQPTIGYLALKSPCLKLATLQRPGSRAAQ